MSGYLLRGVLAYERDSDPTTDSLEERIHKGSVLRIGSALSRTDTAVVLSPGVLDNMCTAYELSGTELAVGFVPGLGVWAVHTSVLLRSIHPEGFMGFGVSGFRVQGSGFRVQGSGFR
eukprot:2383981-Rhodomonas_salina.1